MKSTVIPLTIIAVSTTLLVVMIVFGEIDFFDGMSCEELDMFMSNNIIDGKYPLETPFTPSQIKNLNEQYNLKCLT